MSWYIPVQACLLVVMGATCPAALVRAQQIQSLEPGSQRPRYQIRLDIDEGATTYWGHEAVHYTHGKQSPTTQLVFWLMPNQRSGQEKDSSPNLLIRGVEVAGESAPFEVHDETTVEVTLAVPLRKGQSLDLSLEFYGKVPDVDAGMTTLPAHFTEQISQVIQTRRRATMDPPFFTVGNTAVLSGFYPVLAPWENNQWMTTIPRGADDGTYIEAADYELEIRSPRGMAVTASGELISHEETGRSQAHVSQGKGLRGLMVLLAPDWTILRKKAGAVEVQVSVHPEDELVGRKILGYAADAVAVYESAFGPYPFPEFRIVETPLVAGRMSASSTTVMALASAYFVDFQSPRGLALPGMIREHAELIEQGIEFHVAYAVARQWWGMVVGVDRPKTHYLDNALATFAALLYYEKVYGVSVAQAQMDAQLKASYRVYRMFGGADGAVNQPAARFRNSFHYTSIVNVKGALFLEAVRQSIGEEALSAALRTYYTSHQFKQAGILDLLRTLDVAAGRRKGEVGRLYTQWITWRRGDQDIARPEYRILVSTDIGPSEEDRPSAFEWLGRMIARQMTRVGKYAVRPF